VAVGEDGEVVGDIFAHRVMIAGKVEGNIYATERVEFHQTAQVRGDVTYGSIGIEHGARVIGLVIQGVDKKSANQASDVIRAMQERR
jgi:cytoskeletal protein CcmA (bactofilin family)